MAEFKISGFCKNSNIAIIRGAFRAAGYDTSALQAVLLLELKEPAPLPDYPNYQL